jgi:hypothetical protein
MTCHNAYTNAKLNSLLQQKGNGTMPTIERTPLKTNTPTVSTNKVEGAATATANAIAVSVGKNVKRRKIRQ